MPSNVAVDDYDDTDDLENSIVLVTKDSEHKLVLDDDSLTNIKTHGSHSLKFKSHPNKLLRYIPKSHHQAGKYHKWCKIELTSDGGPHSNAEETDQSILTKWSCKTIGKTPFVSMSLQGDEYIFEVDWWHIKEGSVIGIVHHIDEGDRDRVMNMDTKKHGQAFEINKDGSISPRDCPEERKLFLGVKGPMTEEEKKIFGSQGATSGYNIMSNDDSKVPDTLGEDTVAKCLGNHVADKRLKTPFTLGIFGEWGAGKTTFFELMKKRLIEIQKEPVPSNENEMAYAGHLYYVEFSAWTYHKENLWASLMFKIFQDLDDQLEIEDMLNASTEGGFSPIEISEALSRGERAYWREHLKDKNINIDDLRDVGKGFASKSFEKIFDKQIKVDNKDMQTAREELAALEGKLAELDRTQYWNKVQCNSRNIIQQALIDKVKKNHSGNIDEAIEELAKSGKSVIELFDENFSWTQQLWVHIKSLRYFESTSTIFLLSFGVIILVASVWVLIEFADELITIIGSVGTAVVTFINMISKVIQDGTENVKEVTDKYADEIKVIKEVAEVFNIDDKKKRNKYQLDIEEKERKIGEIQNRLKVLAGQSMRDFVKERVNSEKYEPMLGMVHIVKKDLDALKTAMFDKYHDEVNKALNGEGAKKMFPRGIPRIILFVDDLDRCDPKKVVDVLEALQLLVKSKLFVAVVALDPRYTCLSLEKKKYREILNSRECPTGMDFMEKIFQMGYRVPAIISDDNMHNFIDKQLMLSLYREESGEATDATERASDDNNGDVNDTANAAEVNLDHGNANETQSPPVKEKNFFTKSFTQDESVMLKSSCILFKLTPRTVKRIINVFRLIKEIDFKKGQNMKADLLRHNLLLLVMAASSETKIGIQDIFIMMEKSSTPKITSANKNLGELVKQHCDIPSEEFECINMLNAYECKDRNDWKKVSDDFTYARSFSFFRSRNSEEKDLVDVLTE